MKQIIKINECPVCDSGAIRKVRRNWWGKSQGRSYLVPALEYYECPNCGEKVYDRRAMQRIESYSPAFAKGRVEKKTA